MNRFIILSIALLPSLAFAGNPTAFGDNVPKNDDAINSMCPIGNEAIDGKTFASYDGHKIGFCCKGCDTKFLGWSKSKKDAFVQAALSGEEKKESVKTKPQQRASEPYTLPTCPVSGQKLGSMGEPIVVTVEGRETRLCCKGCVSKMTKDQPKYLAVIDRGLAAQQKPYYPVATCVVSGEPLVEEGKDVGIDVIVKNRLFRLCCKGCVRKLKTSPDTYFSALNDAVKKAQDKSYPLDTCIVREKSKLGSMGDPAEIVVGNRLVRFCCAGCEPKFTKNPTKYLATLDAAWAPIHAKRAEAKVGHGETKDGHDHHKD